ncbi:DUF447 domain-containing protein [Methylomonas sp. AM2-LC]|uniref:DUF447 domain-containing protein n=1 Tax=Methylomonas sp. AM2-LC TaxID=3153301 RepID=UPI0032665E84
MIQEVLISTINAEGETHIAPMGVHVDANQLIVLPFKPSLTLDNLLQTKTAAINYSDDVRIFAGCVTGRRDWPLLPTECINGNYLADALAHTEVKLEQLEDDSVRPRLFCTRLHSVNHKPFQGFNRAQYSVLEAAILVSRLGRLPWEKISSELDYLRIGLEKTGGDREWQAWGWLMQAIEEYRLNSEDL